MSHTTASARVLVALSIPLALAGCAGSLDPAPDRDRARTLTAERTALSPLGADAAATPSAELSADEAVRRALAFNPEVELALERLGSSRADLVQAGLLPNPVLNVGIGFPIDGEGGTTSIGVSLMQQLTAIIQHDRRTSAAQADLESAVLSAADTSLRIAAETRAAHARILFTQQSLGARESAVANSTRARDRAQRNAAAGETTLLEVNRRETRLIGLETELAQARADHAAAKRELARLMGDASASVEWTVIPSTDDRTAAALETAQLPISEADLPRLVTAQRLDCAAAAARADAAATRAGLAKGAIWNDLEAGAMYDRDDEGRDEFGPALNIPIPIFDTGSAARAKATSEARQAELERRIVIETAIAEARTAHAAAEADLTILRGRAAELSDIADRNLALSERAFQAGTIELTALLEAEEAVTEARLRLLELRQRAALRLIELERAVGGRF